MFQLITPKRRQTNFREITDAEHSRSHFWKGIASTQLPDNFRKDPAERILIAIARRYNISLLTCDQKILNWRGDTTTLTLVSQ